MSKKIIMVIPRDILFGNDYFQGFQSADKIDYQARILKNFQWIERDIAEEDSSFQQPIGYSIIVNSKLKKVFAYQRSTKDAKYGEKRLQGKWSWGVGGHIEKLDTASGNPIIDSIVREIKEEVGLKNSFSPKLLGYINNDTDAVGKVHFGMLYLIETAVEVIKPKDSEIDQGEFKTIQELEAIIADPNLIVEEWSKIAFEPLKKYYSF